MSNATNRTFDATVDFHDGDALEAELYTALKGTSAGEPFSVVIFADGDCETGYVFVDDETLPELSEDDWCITANTVADAAQMLRDLL